MDYGDSWPDSTKRNRGFGKLNQVVNEKKNSLINFGFFKINKIEAEKQKNASVHLKFEPFILHVCCRTLFHAKRMVILF